MRAAGKGAATHGNGRLAGVRVGRKVDESHPSLLAAPGVDPVDDAAGLVEEREQRLGLPHEEVPFARVALAQLVLVDLHGRAHDRVEARLEHCRAAVPAVLRVVRLEERRPLVLAHGRREVVDVVRHRRAVGPAGPGEVHGRGRMNCGSSKSSVGP